MNKIIAILTITFIIVSCSEKKVVSMDFSATPKNEKELIARVNSKNNSPDWLSLKGKVNITKVNQDATLNVSIKNRKDSLIWISVSAPFGIEIIRTKITPDTIYFINRANKTYLLKPIKYISETLERNISFLELQSIITANPIILKKRYKLEFSENNFILNSEKLKYVVNELYRIEVLKLSNGEKNIEIEFGDFQVENNFPKKIEIKVNSKEQFQAKLSYSKIEFDKEQSTPFKVPESYDEIK